MKNVLTLVLFLFLNGCLYSQNTDNDKTPYGSNIDVGKHANVNGIKMYYEEYGNGKPVFLIHGNGGTIKTMENHIEYLRTKYRVIAADSRGHGKSKLATDSLTYIQMEDDWLELATHLKVDSMNIIVGAMAE